MGARTRWGILGTGGIARKMAEALRFLDDAELFAVGSRSAEPANAFGDEFAIPRRHASYEALANDPDVDAVYVATPHPMHAPNSILCLEAGRPVLCEKPFTVNAAEAARVIETARQHGVFCMEAMWTRFLPSVTAVRKRIADGAIGEVRMVQADFGFRGGFDPSHRLFDPRLAGGGILDVGVYPVSFATMVLGHPERVVALAEMGETGVDEQTGMLLACPGGAVAVLACAIRTMTAQQCWILGTEGRIHLHSPWWQCQKVTVYAGGGEETLEYPLDCNGFEYQAREVMRCLREGLRESPILPLDESAAVMRTLDAIRGEAGVRYPMEQPGAGGH